MVVLWLQPRQVALLCKEDIQQHQHRMWWITSARPLSRSALLGYRCLGVDGRCFFFISVVQESAVVFFGSRSGSDRCAVLAATPSTSCFFYFLFYRLIKIRQSSCYLSKKNNGHSQRILSYEPSLFLYIFQMLTVTLANGGGERDAYMQCNELDRDLACC